LLLLLATLAALLRLAATAIPAALPLASRGDLAALLATALAGSAFFLLALLHLRHAFRRLRPY
jgi:hypothetical protein